MTVCSQGPRTDAAQYMQYRRIATWMRWLSKTIAAKDEEVLKKAWETVASGAATVGAVSIMMKAVMSLGWQWSAPRTIEADGETFTCPMDKKRSELFKHTLRETLRQRELRDTRSTRGGAD